MRIDGSRTAFLAIDIQNDFCPGGALAVEGGDEIVPLVNELAATFGLCVATQDWHPAGHCSFASARPAGGPWPDHCVQGTRGAELHPALRQEPFRLILRKGFRPDLDSYSAFYENDRATPTGLDGYLRGLGASAVVVAGLALDYCVYYSALDAARLGYSVAVVSDATRAVGSPEGSVDAALADLRSRGVAIIDSLEVFR